MGMISSWLLVWWNEKSENIGTLTTKQNDANLQMAKNSLKQWLQNVHQPAPDENILHDRLLCHLGRVQHLIVSGVYRFMFSTLS